MLFVDPQRRQQVRHLDEDLDCGQMGVNTNGEVIMFGNSYLYGEVIIVVVNTNGEVMMLGKYILTNGVNTTGEEIMFDRLGKRVRTIERF